MYSKPACWNATSPTLSQNETVLAVLAFLVRRVIGGFRTVGAEIFVDLGAGGDLLLSLGVFEQQAYLFGLLVDAVDRPGVEDWDIGEKVFCGGVLDARGVGRVDTRRVCWHFGRIGPGQDRGPMH